jgi:hypothetical protein
LRPGIASPPRGAEEAALANSQRLAAGWNVVVAQCTFDNDNQARWVLLHETAFERGQIAPEGSAAALLQFDADGVSPAGQAKHFCDSPEFSNACIPADRERCSPSLSR